MLLLWLALSFVKIAEAIVFEMNQILIRAEALRWIVDFVEQVTVVILGLENADLLVSG